MYPFERPPTPDTYRAQVLSLLSQLSAHWNLPTPGSHDHLTLADAIAENVDLADLVAGRPPHAIELDDVKLAVLFTPHRPAGQFVTRAGTYPHYQDMLTFTEQHPECGVRLNDHCVKVNFEYHGATGDVLLASHFITDFNGLPELMPVATADPDDRRHMQIRAVTSGGQLHRGFLQLFDTFLRAFGYRLALDQHHFSDHARQPVDDDTPIIYVSVPVQTDQARVAGWLHISVPEASIDFDLSDARLQHLTDDFLSTHGSAAPA